VGFILGSLIHQVSVAEAGTAGLDAVDKATLVAALEQAEYTNVRDLLPVLAEHDHDGDFEFGLELLIGAMESLPRDG
jgi:Tetracyclin repressor-like, C-terminal domain